MNAPLDSYKTSLDKISFDEEAKARMASELGAAARRIEGAGAPGRFGVVRGRQPMRPMRRIAAVAAGLAAALVLAGGGGVAVAAGVLPNPADVLSDVFGGGPAQTELLGDTGRPVDASATSNGVTVAADAVIGDQSNCTVVYSIAFDDPSVLDGLEPGENGMLPLVADASTHIDGTMSGGGSAWFFDADPTDNTIQFVESLSFTTWNGEGIIGNTVRFSLSGIRTLPEHGEGRAVASGRWDLKFAANYVDTTVEMPNGQETEWMGSDVRIDSVAVSTVGISVDYTIDRQMGDLGPSGKMSDEAQTEQDAVIGLPITVSFADGSAFDATSANSTAVKQDDGTSAVTKAATYERIVGIEDIESVTVGDVTLTLNAK